MGAPIRVVHLSTSDSGGGAARAAYRLHSGLRLLGVDSRMLALRNQTGDPTVSKLKWSNDPLTRFWRWRRHRKIERDFAPYKSTLPAGFEWFSDDRSEAGLDLVRQIPPCDIINLHWVGGFVDYEMLFSHLPKGVPVVWRLADMAPMTGGCHYDGGCGKFTARCGACPVLGSSKDSDLSRKIWTRKQRAFARLKQLNLVGTSRWIAAEAKRSSLLGRFPVTVIPNGLNTEDFAPRDKGTARDALGVPRDKKVVLFVAESAEIRRKGFDYLAEALNGLRDRTDLFLLSVGNARPDVVKLPQLHLGRVGADRVLSDVYSAADVFVIPSLQESFGQTITESLACGTPVIGFDTGGIPDMVRPGITGYLAAVGDADELRRQIVRLLDDPAKRDQMRDVCREIVVKEYSLQTQAKAYLNLYETLVAAQ